MTPLTTAQVALAVIGLLVWGYGARIEDGRIGWVGIAMVAAASVLRFAKRREPPDAE